MTVNRRHSIVPALALAALVVLAACGDTAPAASPAPSFSFAPDVGLAAKFPTTVDGKPVTDLQTGTFADVIGQLGAPQGTLTQLNQALSTVGIDFATLTFGSAIATLDNQPLRLQALRTPNADGNVMLRNYAVFVDAFSQALGTSPISGPITTQTTIAGKAATLVTYSDGNRTLLSVSGDTMFIVDNATDAQNSKIVAALP